MSLTNTGTKQDIDIMRKTQCKMTITLKNQDGAAYNIGTGETLRFMLKRQRTGAEILNKLFTTTLGSNVATLTLSPTDTDKTPDDYIYENILEPYNMITQYGEFSIRSRPGAP